MIKVSLESVLGKRPASFSSSSKNNQKTHSILPKAMDNDKFVKNNDTKLKSMNDSGCGGFDDSWY
jgi:hypothetical protein